MSHCVVRLNGTEEVEEFVKAASKCDLKIYLTASSRTRAERRYKELVEKGQRCNIDDIEKDIIDRDYRDMHREVSPLVQAEDAVLVESSDMTIEQVVEAITKLVK